MWFFFSFSLFLSICCKFLANKAKRNWIFVNVIASMNRILRNWNGDWFIVRWTAFQFFESIPFCRISIHCRHHSRKKKTEIIKSSIELFTGATQHHEFEIRNAMQSQSKHGRKKNRFTAWILLFHLANRIYVVGKVKLKRSK